MRLRLMPLKGSRETLDLLRTLATAPSWTQVSWRRSQLRQPSGRSSHLTFLARQVAQAVAGVSRG